MRSMNGTEIKRPHLTDRQIELMEEHNELMAACIVRLTRVASLLTGWKSWLPRRLAESFRLTKENDVDLARAAEVLRLFVEEGQ